MRPRIIGLWLLVTPILAYTFQIQAGPYPTPSPSPPPTPPACEAGKQYIASSDNCFYQADNLATAKVNLLYYQKKLDADQGNLNVDNRAIEVYTNSLAKVNAVIASNEQLKGNILTNKWCWVSRDPTYHGPYNTFIPYGPISPMPGNWIVQEIASPPLKVTYNDRENLKRVRQEFGSCTTYPEFQDVPADPIEYLNYQAVSQTPMGEYQNNGSTLVTGLYVFTGTNPKGNGNCNLQNTIDADRVNQYLTWQKNLRTSLESARAPWYPKQTADSQAAALDQTGIDTWAPEVNRWTSFPGHLPADSFAASGK